MLLQKPHCDAFVRNFKNAFSLWNDRPGGRYGDGRQQIKLMDVDLFTYN